MIARFLSNVMITTVNMDKVNIIHSLPQLKHRTLNKQITIFIQKEYMDGVDGYYNVLHAGWLAAYSIDCCSCSMYILYLYT